MSDESRNEPESSSVDDADSGLWGTPEDARASRHRGSPARGAALSVLWWHEVSDADCHGNARSDRG